ncbi:MAG: YggT family protein [Bacillaceae bacterium]|nr:YggT family protein [Bacillaceae bacterium]
MEESILGFVALLLRLYFYAMIVYILSSWVPGLRDGRFGEVLGSIVDPYLSVFRRFIPPIGMIDISPIFAILVYQYVIFKYALIGVSTILGWF